MLWLLATQGLLFLYVRRSHSGVAAIGACIFVALSPFALLPGVMGFSVAASRFAALAAVTATVWLLTTSRPRPFHGVVAGLATVPGDRAVHTGLLARGHLPRREPAHPRLPGKALSRAIGAPALRPDAHHGCGGGGRAGMEPEALDGLVDGGGETLAQLASSQETMQKAIGADISGREPTRLEVARLAWFQVEKNLPDLLFYLNPNPMPLPVDETVVTSPPRTRLVLLWFVPFVLVGLARAIRRGWHPHHAIFLIYAVGVIPVALTCSFLRAFRIDLLVLPAAVWCGLGVDWVVARVRSLAPAWLLHLVAVAAITAGSLYTARYLGWPGDLRRPAGGNAGPGPPRPLRSHRHRDLGSSRKRVPDLPGPRSDWIVATSARP